MRKIIIIMMAVCSFSIISWTMMIDNFWDTKPFTDVKYNLINLVFGF